MVDVETAKPPLPYPHPTHPDPGYCEGCGPNCTHCAKGPRDLERGGPIRAWDVLEGGWQCGADNAAYLASLEDPHWREAYGPGDASPPPVGAASSSRPSWDTYFARIAEVVASRADCTKAQVGCVIVSPEHRIVATGYNGPPPGDTRSCTGGDCPRGLEAPGQSGGSYEDCIALHAEQNAIAYAGQQARGGTAYIMKAPCDMCSKVLAAAGVVRVVVGGQVLDGD